jgi:hypothetical protein
MCINHSHTQGEYEICRIEYVHSFGNWMSFYSKIMHILYSTHMKRLWTWKSSFIASFARTHEMSESLISP